MTQPLSYDIIIAGGGLSGCLAALSLAKLTKADGSLLSIAIIEANEVAQTATPLKAQNKQQHFDERVLALSHSTASYLNELAVWQSLSAYANPIETIHISDRGYYGKARIYAKDHQVDAVGYVAEMKKVGEALLVALKPFDNIDWFYPDSIEDITWQLESVNVELTSGKHLTAELLLACDGAKSRCRTLANIKTQTKAYGQSAIVTNVSMHQPHNNIAYERFTESGPIAMLPLTGNRCSLVWTLTPEKADYLQECDDATFIAELNQVFGFWQGGVKTLGKRVVFPLNLVTANENIHHRMMLVGNASHTIHPIAGQGFNLGVRDVITLTHLIEQSLQESNNTYQKTADIGCLLLLNEYANQRKRDQQQIIELTDSLVTYFSNDLPPLVAGRNTALKVLNYLSPLKKAFVNKTMGY